MSCLTGLKLVTTLNSYLDYSQRSETDNPNVSDESKIVTSIKCIVNPITVEFKNKLCANSYVVEITEDSKLFSGTARKVNNGWKIGVPYTKVVLVPAEWSFPSPIISSGFLKLHMFRDKKCWKGTLEIEHQSNGQGLGDEGYNIVTSTYVYGQVTLVKFSDFAQLK